jgi:rRNA maturation endonuclease Nob1
MNVDTSALKYILLIAFEMQDPEWQCVFPFPKRSQREYTDVCPSCGRTKYRCAVMKIKRIYSAY